MDRDELIKRMQSVAKELGKDRLTLSAFRQHSGVSRTILDKHFDSWSQACDAAGLKTGQTIGQFSPSPRSKEECIAEMRRVANLLDRVDLSSKVFTKHAEFTSKPVIKRFGSWHEALKQAGLEPTAKAKSDINPITDEECITEIKRVATALNQTYLAYRDFNKHAKFSAGTVVRRLGNWHTASSKAGLEVPPTFNEDIPLNRLAIDFLNATIELNKIPSLVQLVRRSKHVAHTYAGKFGGYGVFKHQAIHLLLSSKGQLPRKIKRLFEDEWVQLENEVSPQLANENAAIPHRQGRTLNFRGFVYAPTCENDVVAMFGAVAEELGFEIIGNRSPFPDCEARRKIPGNRENFKKCLIEYEFSSTDYKKQKHPITGCDLIVCWIHNWPKCPIEVLELEKKIRDLPGWR